MPLKFMQNLRSDLLAHLLHIVDTLLLLGMSTVPVTLTG